MEPRQRGAPSGYLAEAIQSLFCDLLEPMAKNVFPSATSNRRASWGKAEQARIARCHYRRISYADAGGLVMPRSRSAQLTIPTRPVAPSGSLDDGHAPDVVPRHLP
jgi:hypothetical protein